jgi:hypothetical protein
MDTIFNLRSCHGKRDPSTKKPAAAQKRVSSKIDSALKGIGARSLRGGEGELGNSKILTYGSN